MADKDTDKDTPLDQEPPSLARTALYPCHLESGARMVPFAGFEMPVQYAGVVAEHQAVRQKAGLFDVSHMGEFLVMGEQALDFLQYLTPNDVAKLAEGQAHYSGLLSEKATFLDDLLIYRLGPDRFMMVVNGACVAQDFAWATSVLEVGGFEASLRDISQETGLIALQGPMSEDLLAPHIQGELDLGRLAYYHFASADVCGVEATVSRTGYTGEDGFEIYVPADRSPEVWRQLLGAGADAGLEPAGLGARDTLRLEAAMMLYGQDIDEETTPLEAKLGWIVKLDKGEFIGREALRQQKAHGVSHRVVGFELTERGIARSGYPVMKDGDQIGIVTSGSWSPTLERAIGLARVPAAAAKIGTEIAVSVRGRGIEARVCKTPFYKRDK